MTLGEAATFPSACLSPPPLFISPLIHLLVDGVGCRRSWTEPGAFNHPRPGIFVLALPRRAQLTHPPPGVWSESPGFSKSKRGDFTLFCLSRDITNITERGAA